MDGIVINGEFIPGRTATGRFGTRSPERLRERGIDADASWDTGKHLYWKAINRRGAAKAHRLGLKQCPYPKPDAQRLSYSQALDNIAVVGYNYP